MRYDSEYRRKYNELNNPAIQWSQRKETYRKYGYWNITGGIHRGNHNQRMKDNREFEEYKKMLQ